MSSSIADEITRLSGCRNDILSAISSMGVTVPEGSVLSSCPSLIQSIPTGGGGGSFSAMYNTAVSSGSASASATASVTGVQNMTPKYDYQTTVLQPMTDYIDYRSCIYAYLDWSSVSASGAISNTNISVEIPFLNYSPDRVTAFALVYDPFGFLLSSKLFNYSEVLGYQMPITASGSVSAAFSDFSQGDWMVHSGSWTDTTKLCFGYRYDYGNIDTATSLGVTATAAVVTGYEYPYPDRPTSEVTTFTASASARELYRQVNGYYVIDGYASNGSTYTNRLGYAPSAATAAARGDITSQNTAYFPSTAYTTTMQSAIVSSSQSGLF